MGLQTVCLVTCPNDFYVGFWCYFSENLTTSVTNSLNWHDPVYQAQENPQEIFRPLIKEHGKMQMACTAYRMWVCKLWINQCYLSCTWGNVKFSCANSWTLLKRGEQREQGGGSVESHFYTCRIKTEELPRVLLAPIWTTFS